MHMHWESPLPGQVPQQNWLKVAVQGATLTSTFLFVFGERHFWGGRVAGPPPTIHIMGGLTADHGAGMQKP